MFSKLSLGNMRRSIKDYTVYFLTLTLAVCIFYMFNALGEQSIILDLSETQTTAFTSLTFTLGIVSIFVVLVLAFLVIYANRFMIKRRKKEFGIYMLLGMPQKKMSSILVLETLLIGLLALGSGLLIGFFASQGLSVAAAYLLNVQIKDYTFYFSVKSLIATLICFGAIYLIVMLFNARTIKKLKLIDLLQDENKAEELKVRKKPAMILLFILGIGLITLSYYYVLSQGAEGIIHTLGPGLLINTGGTLLFFASISGIYISALQKNKKRYFKGLTMFSCRQMSSKVNSNFVSMSFICEMLFLTIVILSTVSGFNNVFKSETEVLSPYDASFRIFQDANPSNMKIEDAVRELVIDENQVFSNHRAFNLYNTDVLLGDVADLSNEEENIQKFGDTHVDAVKLSDFNYLMEMQGKEAISLNENQYAVLTLPDTIIQPGLDLLYQNPKSVNIAGSELTLSGDAARVDNIWTSPTGFNFMLLIIPDGIADSLSPRVQIYSADYAGDKQDVEDYLLNIEGDKFIESTGTEIFLSTKMQINANSSALSIVLIFVGMYLGIVFLIAGAAILALQQLTEASDSRPRYELLRKIGANEKLINNSLFGLVSAYFMLPLALAAIHSVFGMTIMFEGLTAMMGVDILMGALCAAAVIVIIYGGYFLATYFGCKNIIKPAYSQRA